MGRLKAFGFVQRFAGKQVIRKYAAHLMAASEACYCPRQPVARSIFGTFARYAAIVQTQIELMARMEMPAQSVLPVETALSGKALPAVKSANGIAAANRQFVLCNQGGFVPLGMD